MSEDYDIKPTEADLNDESLFAQAVDATAGLEDRANTEKFETNVNRLADSFDTHSGYRGCQKCETVGAHQWHMICTCCGQAQGRFHEAEYLESDVAFD
jgi:hypothetical protein